MSTKSTKIITKYSSHPTSRAGRIIAKSNGRQKTVPYDYAKSRYGNHQAAAEALVGQPVELIDNDPLLSAGARATFQVIETVTSRRSGQVYKIVEWRGDEAEVEDGQTIFVLKRDNMLMGGDYSPKTAAAWNGGPAARF